jgi:hypothetical protein
MISRIVSMTLYRARVANSRAQRAVAFCEVAPDSDRLSDSADPAAASRLDSWSQACHFDDPSPDLSFAV